MNLTPEQKEQFRSDIEAQIRSYGWKTPFLARCEQLLDTVEALQRENTVNLTEAGLAKLEIEQLRAEVERLKQG